MNITGYEFDEKLYESDNKLYEWPHEFKKMENADSNFIKKCEQSIHDAINDIPLKIVSLYKSTSVWSLMFLKNANANFL